MGRIAEAGGQTAEAGQTAAEAAADQMSELAGSLSEQGEEPGPGERPGTVEAAALTLGPVEAGPVSAAPSGHWVAVGG